MSRNVILCVDDEKMILESLREQIVERFGDEFEVEIGEGGEEGLEITEEVAEDGDNLALVISDQLMPGMKGDEFLVHVHKEFPETLKILLTGQADLESVGKAINHARIYRYVVKPWQEEDLMLTVEKALNSYKQYLQLQEYNRLLHSLNAAIQEISSEVNLESVINKVLKSTIDSVQAERGYLLMQEGNELKLSGATSAVQEDDEKLHALLKENGAQLTEELVQKISKALTTGGKQPQLVSPINKKGKNLGYVFLENPSTKKTFNDNQRQILQMLTSQAAISLDNANLYARLEEKTESLEEVNKVIKQKNEDITSSIRYAKRIQEAILPKVESLKPFCWNSDVYYRPKDIVSGDFYWWIDKDEYFFVCAADCTGHGVPGGFMSVLSTTMLSESVNVYGLTDPDAILTLVSVQMRAVLRQDEQNTTKDGMDCALLAVNQDQTILKYAGARRHLYLYRNEELQVIKADKLSIAELPEDGDVKFTCHTIEIQPGDTFYMFSDGVIDQFGGPDNRRFNRKRFAKAIEQAQKYPATEHSRFIGKQIEEWMGDYEQTDDMLLMTLRF